MSTDSIKKTLGVALGVCFVCSVLVSMAAVYLKPLQEANKSFDKKKNILKAGKLLDESKAGDKKLVDKIFADNITPVLIKLKNGEQLTTEQMTGNLTPETYDIKKLSKDTEASEEITDDIAGISRVPKHSLIYMVKEDGKTSDIIFPVHGKGLWSTMYGLFALNRDLKTVSGFTFYEHGETPGLGGEIDNPNWQASWEGKLAFDDDGNITFKLLKGKAAPGSKYEIDGLSGATLTARGVEYLLKFWFGPEGYGPYLAKLRKEGINE
ncbi:MAG: Na(+)-translocating NADH-quinone reductase subunit C [bacterium]|nr:Na(+)-translocating NADH-quinone reductase subunit C [bacterium]